MATSVFAGMLAKFVSRDVANGITEEIRKDIDKWVRDVVKVRVRAFLGDATVSKEELPPDYVGGGEPLDLSKGDFFLLLASMQPHYQLATAAAPISDGGEADPIAVDPTDETAVGPTAGPTVKGGKGSDAFNGAESMANGGGALSSGVKSAANVAVRVAGVFTDALGRMARKPVDAFTSEIAVATKTPVKDLKENLLTDKVLENAIVLGFRDLFKNLASDENTMTVFRSALAKRIEVLLAAPPTGDIHDSDFRAIVKAAPSTGDIPDSDFRAIVKANAAMQSTLDTYARITVDLAETLRPSKYLTEPSPAADTPKDATPGATAPATAPATAGATAGATPGATAPATAPATATAGATAGATPAATPAATAPATAPATPGATAGAASSAASSAAPGAATDDAAFTKEQKETEDQKRQRMEHDKLVAYMLSTRDIVDAYLARIGHGAPKDPAKKPEEKPPAEEEPAKKPEEKPPAATKTKRERGTVRFFPESDWKVRNLANEDYPHGYAHTGSGTTPGGGGRTRRRKRAAPSGDSAERRVRPRGTTRRVYRRLV